MTPTIPVANLSHFDYLDIGFLTPLGILIDLNNCSVKIRDKQTVTVRVIAQCTNRIKGPTKADKVIIPVIKNTHSLFWSRELHLPPVWVIPFFVIFDLCCYFSYSYSTFDLNNNHALRDGVVVGFSSS